MTGRGSRLGRLYMYSKDSAAIAQENFTTEALAMAIEEDSLPMLEALCRLDRARAERVGFLNASILRPATQVALPRGRLDLVLYVVDALGRITGEVWIEVKINAPESGQQLDYYQQCAGPSVWLLTLAHTPPRPDMPDLDNLTWNELYQSARHGRAAPASWAAGSRWRDLGTFLEEQNVADDALGPISDTEAAALEPAYKLIQKVSGVVIAAHKEIRELFPHHPQLRFATEGSLVINVALNLRAAGEMVACGGPLVCGLCSQDGTAYWQVAVDTRNLGKDAVTQVHAKVQAEATSSLSGWERPPTGSRVIVARARATQLVTRDEASKWFGARLRELKLSGIVETALTAPESGPSPDQLIVAGLSGVGDEPLLAERLGEPGKGSDLDLADRANKDFLSWSPGWAACSLGRLPPRLHPRPTPTDTGPAESSPRASSSGVPRAGPATFSPTTRRPRRCTSSISTRYPAPGWAGSATSSRPPTSTSTT